MSAPRILVLSALIAGAYASDYALNLNDIDAQVVTYSAMGDSETTSTIGASGFLVWDETTNQHIRDPITGSLIWKLDDPRVIAVAGDYHNLWAPGQSGWVPLRPYLQRGDVIRLVSTDTAVPFGYPYLTYGTGRIIDLTVDGSQPPSNQSTFRTDGEHVALTGPWKPVADNDAGYTYSTPGFWYTYHGNVWGAQPSSQGLWLVDNRTVTLRPTISSGTGSYVVSITAAFSGHSHCRTDTYPWTPTKIANQQYQFYRPLTVRLDVVSGPHVGMSATANVVGDLTYVPEAPQAVTSGNTTVTYYTLTAIYDQLYAGFSLTSSAGSANGKDVLVATVNDAQVSDPLTIDWGALPPIAPDATEKPGPRDCPACAGQLVATTSVVQSGLQAHIHEATDYAPGDEPAGCASCGSAPSPATGALPSLEIHRYHRYLDQSWHGSFGNGVFLGYDHRLVVHAAARVIEWWAPDRPVVTLLKDPSGTGTFSDDRYHDVAGASLLDSHGAPVADPALAASAALSFHDGSSAVFELFAGADESGDTRLGRLVATLDRNGQGMTLVYLVGATAATSEDGYEIDSITDAHGLSARCGYGLCDGHPVITAITLPNGARLIYGYADAGSLVGLRSVAFPDGASAAFDTYWSASDNQQIVRYDDPGATGIHRRKKVGFTPVEALWSGGAIAIGPNRVRSVTNGDGELVYKSWLEQAPARAGVVKPVYLYFFDGGDDAHGKTLRRLTLDDGLILSSERAITWSWTTGEATWTWQKEEDDALDATQRLVARTTPGVGTTTYQRDPSTGVITKRGYPDGSSETTTDNQFDQPLREVDRLGRVTTSAYDAAGNLLAKTVADGTPEASTTRWVYGEAGANARAGQPTSRIDPLGNVTRFVYDAHGFLAAIIEPKDAPTGNANPTRRFTHDAAGLLIATADESGREVRYAYDQRNRLISITYGDGSSEGILYGTGSADGNLPVLRHDRNGNYTLIRYDCSGRETTRYEGLVVADAATASPSLASFANPDAASVTTTSYVAGTDLIASRIENGQETDYAYDGFRREISRSWSNLNGQLIAELTTWDASGRVDSRGHQVNGLYTWSTLYVYDVLDRVVRTIREAAYHSAAALTTPALRLAAARAAVPTFLIEDRGYEVAAGAVGYTPADPIKDRVCEIRTSTDARGIVHLDAFDHQGRVVEHVDALGTLDMARTAFAYDAAGNRTRVYQPRHFTEAGGFTTAFAYTGRNLRALVREAEGRPEQSDTVTTYTATGKVASVTTAAGTADAATTVYRYGACCDRLREMQDAEGFLTEYLYDANGNTTAVVDPLQHATVMEYDSRNRVVRRIDGEGHVTRLLYDDNVFDGHGLEAINTSVWQGLTVVTQAGRPVSAPRAAATIDATGAVSYVVGDQLGRTWSVFDALGNKTAIMHDDFTSESSSTTDPLGDYTAVDADGAGRITDTTDAEFQTTTYTVDGNGNRLTTTDPNGNGPIVTYDRRDRVATVTDKLGSSVTNTYDAQGNLVATRDALGRTTAFAYDGRNRKVSSTDRLGGVTLFAYDGRNNLVAMQDAEHRVTTYLYDRRNLLIAETFPGATGGTRTYAYDAAGRLQQRIDQTGTATTYAYDRANRLTARHYPDGLDDLFAYDAVGRLTHAASGRYRNAIDRAYDAGGRLVSETQTIGGVAYVVGRTYDAANHVTHIAYPGGDAVDRSYTARDQLKQVSFGGTPVVTRTYDLGMRLNTTQYFPLAKIGGAANETRKYNADDTVKSIIVPGLTSLTYNYNGDKSVTNETDGILAAHSQTFAYDDEQRLTVWSRGTGDAQSWHLTPVGDWQDTTVDGALETRTHSDVHELTSITRATATTPLGYDVKGNLTLDQNGAHYGWDAENRLQTATITDEIENVGDVATYSYDALGRRVQKTAWGVTTTFLHDGDQVIREFDAPQQLPASAANDDGDGSGTPPGGGILPNALVRVNFQPALRAIPPGFVADKGKIDAARSNGYIYGWDIDRTADAVSRGVHPLLQYDTFVRMASNAAAPGTWTIALPNGTYPIVVVMGDAVSRHQTNNVVIQGIAETDPDPYDPNETQGYLLGDFDGYAELVTVTNGLLTIQVGSGAIDPKLCFLEIGHNGDPLDHATKDKLAAQVGSATQRTGGTPFPKPQPSPREYAYGTYLDEPLMYSAAGTKYAVLANRQYSVEALVDGSGNVAERYEYDSYGKRTVLNAAGVAIGTDSTVAFERGYTGLRVDRETGLLQAQYRMYDTRLGRWISRDPLGYVDGQSLYLAYFAPGGADPTGAFDVRGCLSGAVGGAGSGFWSVAKGAVKGAWHFANETPWQQFMEGLHNAQQSERVFDGIDRLAELVESGKFEQALSVVAPEMIAKWKSGCDKDRCEIISNLIAKAVTIIGGAVLTGGAAAEGEVAAAADMLTIELETAAETGSAIAAEHAAARVAAEITGGDAASSTVGQILNGFSGDAMIHLTPATAGELASGVDAGTVFVRLGDVAHLTVPEYQALVVGRLAAASPGENVLGFVVSTPGADSFLLHWEQGAAGVSEFKIVGPVAPGDHAYVPLPDK